MSPIEKQARAFVTKLADKGYGLNDDLEDELVALCVNADSIQVLGRLVHAIDMQDEVHDPHMSMCLTDAKTLLGDVLLQQKPTEKTR